MSRQIAYQSNELVSKPDRLYERIVLEPRYFLESLVEIPDKDRQTVPFILNPPQVRYYLSRSLRDIILKPRQLGFCCHPNTRILTTDLKWIPIKDIEIGQKVIATDEYPSGGYELATGEKRRYPRKLRTAIVEKKNTIFEVAYKLKTDDGRELILTGRHKLLSKLRRGDPTLSFKLKYGQGDGCGQETLWRKVEDFRVGDKIRSIVEPWEESSGNDRWFGGVMDSSGKSRGIAVSVTIRKNDFLFDKVVSYLKSKNYHYRITTVSYDYQTHLYEKVRQLLPSAIMNFQYRRSCGNSYYIDIAVPELKIAIEFDSKHWHRDKKSDEERQLEIEKDGWKFLRYTKMPSFRILQKDIGNMGVYFNTYTKKFKNSKKIGRAHV